MQFPSVTAEQFAAAIVRFDTELRNSVEWADWERRQTHKFAIRSNGKSYPVKQLISMATKLPVSAFSGGQEANDFAIANGLRVEPIVHPAEASDDIEVVLQNLILHDSDLRKLEDGLSELNLFEAIGAVRSELRHSDFLAFLLDPSGNHGLRDIFIKRLAQRAILSAPDMPSAVSPLQLGVWNLDDCKVERELDNTDILIVSDANKLVLMIENKVDSGEHDDQLSKYYERVARNYPNHRRLFFYLTADASEASHPAYIPISYGMICQIVEELLEARLSSLYPDVALLLRHYAKLLRRHFMDESELISLARRIYANHRTALDYIYEQRPDFVLAIKENLEKLIRERQDLVLDDSTKTYIRFAAAEWSDGDLLKGEGWTSSKRVLLFEFKNVSDRINLSLFIGPGDKEVRQRLFEFCYSHQPPFRIRGQLNDRWNSIWTTRFASSTDLEDENSEALGLKLSLAWNQFITNDLPKMRSIIKEFIGRSS